MASQNRDIKMRIFLDAANAEKAYNAMMRNIESGQKRLKELKEKKKTSSLTEAEAAEMKQIQQDVKAWKILVKEVRSTYDSITESVRNANALAIRELEGLIKSTRDQLRSLVPGKDDADITRLSQALGVFQRELAERNKQILHQSQRSFNAILEEINTSQQHLAEISTKGANAAAARQNQLEAQKQLTRLEQKRRNEEDKFAQHQQEVDKRAAAFDAAAVGRKQEIIAAIQKQVVAEADLEILLAKKRRPKSFDADKQTKEQTLANAKQRVEAILAANASEADSINNLIQLYRDYAKEKLRPVRQPNADKWDASIAAQKQKVLDATNAAIAAEKEYNAARSKAGTDTPYQQSIETLKKLYAELEAVRNKETEVAERMKMTDQLKEMDRIIQEMEGKRMSMQQARQISSSPYTAQIEQLKQAREAWEAYRLTLSSNDINGLREVDAAIKNIDNATLRARESASNWSRTLLEARNAMIGSNKAVNGTSLESLRQQYERLKQARDLVTQEPARNAMNEQLRQMEQRIKEMQTQMMSGKQVSDVYNQAIAEIGKGTAANSSKLRENIELMKIAQQSKDIDAQTYNRLSAAIKVSTDMLNKEGNSYMTTGQAFQSYRQGKALIAQGENASVDAIRQTINAMTEAQHIEGISVKQKAIYAGMVERLTELLKQEHKITISEREAETIYANGINNTVGNLRAAIDAFKALANAESTSAEKAAEYNTKVRELNDLMTKQHSSMTAAQALGLANTGNGTVAQLTEAKKVLEEWKQSLAATDVSGLQKVDDAIRSIDERMKGNVPVITSEVSAVDQYAKAQDMLRNTSRYTADELRRQQQIMQQAATARGLSLDITQKCAAAEREFADLLKQSNTSTMTAVEAETKIAEAKVMLENIYLEETSAIKTMIDQLKLAENAEGMLLVRSQEAVGIRTQMEQALKRSAGAAVDVAKIDAILTAGEKAQVGEINAAIAALEAENNAWNTTAETKKRNLTLMEQLRAMTSVTRKEATALAYDEKAVKFALDNIRTVPVDKLREAIQMLRHEIDHVEKDQQKFIQKSSELKELEAHYKSLKGSVNGVTKSIRDQGTWFEKATTKLMNYIGIFGGFFMLRQKMQEWFKTNLKFDDQLTNIRKTTNMTSEAVKQLADDIKHISTRTSIESLNDLAYTAGKLGVKSVSDVMGFVRAADMLNVSLSEQLGDNATEQLMKIANIMGTMDQYGLEESLERIGGSITYLAKNSQASAQPIVDFMKRTAGIARQSGVTTSELAGLGAAISALGQPVEMSATSFSKMMVQMEKNHVAVAKALQMTSEETRRLKLDLSTGNAMEAFLTMLRKVRELGGLSQTSIIAKDLGSEGNRVIQTLTTLSSSYETIERMVRQSSKAFQENITVQDEYSKKNENTAALWEKLKNNFSKLFISTEATDYIHDFLQQLQFLPKVASDIIAAMRPVGELVANVILVAFKDFSHVLTGIVKAMFFRTLVSWVASLGLRFVELGAAIRGIPAAMVRFKASIDLAQGGVSKLGAGLRGFFNMLKGAQFGNIFTAVLGGLMIAIDYVRNLNSETKEFLRTTAKEIENVKETANATSVELEGMIDELGKASTTAERKKEIYEQLNNTYKDYLSNLGWETMEYQDQVRLLRQVNSQLQMKQMLAARDARIQEIRTEGNDITGPLRTQLRNEVLEAMHIDPGEATQSQKSTAESIVAELIKRQDEILDKDTSKKAGERYDADKTVTNQLNDSEQAKYDALYGAFGKTKVWKGIQNYNDIAEALEEYANAADKINQQIEDTASEFNAQAMNAGEGVDATMAGFKKTMDEVYGAFSDNFSQHGNFDVTTELTQAIKDTWADQKESMTKKDRNDEIAKLNTYIEAAKNYVDDVLLKYGAESQEYQKANNTYLNAMAYRDILSYGNIVSEPPEPPKTPVDDAYKNIIANVQEIYKHIAEQIEDDFKAGKMTRYSYERAIKENEREMYFSLSSVKEAIANEDAAYNALWLERIKVIKQQVDKSSNKEALDAYNIVEKKSTTGGGMRSVLSKLIEKRGEDNATRSGIKKEAADDARKGRNIDADFRLERMNAWLEQNPLGKLSSQYQTQFETLGIMLADLTPSADAATQSVTELTAAAMDAYRAIGQNAYTINISAPAVGDKDSGIEQFRKYIMQFPMLAERAKEATSEDLMSIYYLSYEYAKQYDEQLQKMAQKTMDIWTQMYNSSDSHKSYEREMRDIEQVKKNLQDLQAFGSTEHFTLFVDLQIQEKKYNEAIAALEDKAQKAFAAKDAADALVATNDTEAEYKRNRQEQAQKLIDELETEGEKVYDIFQSLLDAQMALRQNTWQWLADLGKTTEKFADAFVPLRSWYEDKGSFSKNVFGTKEEREKAFAEFMDDIKKQTRAVIMEQTKLWLMKKMGVPEGASEQAKSDSDEVRKKIGGIIKRDGDDTSSDPQFTDVAGLQQNKADRLQVVTDAHLAEEEEERRHRAEMDAINGIQRDEDGNAAAADGESEANADSPAFDQDQIRQMREAAFAEEVSLEDGLNKLKIQMRSKAEQELLKLTKQGLDKVFGFKKKNAKDQKQLDKEVADASVDTNAAANAEVLAADKTMTGAEILLSDTQATVEKQNSSETSAQEIADKTASTNVGMWGSFGEAIAKAWAQGGPYLGPILAGVVSAALGAVMTMVFNMIGSGKSKTPTKTKLVSGMLTYDTGNIQTVFGRGVGVARTYDRGRRPIDEYYQDENGVYQSAAGTGKHPVMGDDGKLYWIDDRDYGTDPQTGLVTRPTLTSIGGQPALVAEHGPEMVIGRATTRALALNEPEVLRTIMRYDTNHSRGFARTFDTGTAGTLAQIAANTAATVPDASTSGLEDQHLTQQQLVDTIASLQQTLAIMQQQGIPAHFNMYGAGGALDQMAEALYESKRRGSNRNVSRLFK